MLTWRLRKGGKYCRGDGRKERFNNDMMSFEGDRIRVANLRVAFACAFDLR